MNQLVTTEINRVDSEGDRDLNAELSVNQRTKDLIVRGITQSSVGLPRWVSKDSSAVIRCGWVRRCRWRGRAQRWWTCKRRVGGRIRRCRCTMRRRNWRNGARWLGSGMANSFATPGIVYVKRAEQYKAETYLATTPARKVCIVSLTPMFSKVVAHAKRQIPTCFMISTATWIVNVVEDWDGRITPIYWLFGIAFTTIGVYIFTTVAIWILRLIQSLFRSKKGRTP